MPSLFFCTDGEFSFRPVPARRGQSSLPPLGIWYSPPVMHADPLESVTGEVILLPDRDRPIRNRHPWVFSGAVASVNGAPADGDLVDVRSSGGEFLGRGMIAPRAAIRVRLLTFDETRIGPALFADRLERAASWRSSLADSGTTACRIVNAEGDNLPGLVVDRYADFLVCQFTAAGIERRREWILGALEGIFRPRGIYLRAARDVRESEGLQLLDGPLHGEVPPPRVEILENGLRFQVSISQGQKTGFYLDQRENRAWIRGLARGRKVLNCHAYTGGFAVAALAGGATSVLSLDRSSPVLDLAQENVQANLPVSGSAEFIVTDAVEWMRSAEPADFGLVVLDPPALARNKATLPRASRAYKELNRQALRLLPPGALLLTCSCSRPLDRSLFHKILFGAAIDAGRQIQIIGESGHPMDHPVSVYHPEGEYLKAILLRVV
jgi:23S rRNA (cytosine1962-C5)-methyltransferase